MLARGLKSHSTHQDNIVISKAVTADDRAAVRDLLWAEYRRQGYIAAPKSQAARLFPFLDTPMTTTFVSRHQGVAYGSMSLVIDSTGGFPMDVVFKSELDELRQQGLKLAEDCYMVVSTEKRQYFRQQHRDKETLSKLFQAIIRQAQEENVDILCGETNPKHELIYTALGFTTIGSTRPNPAVNGAPAVGKVLDLRHLNELMQKHPVLRVVLQS